MPCMGPDLNAARKKGNKVGERMLLEFIVENNLWDITDPEYKKMIQFPGSKERWIKAKEKFIEAVEDLFVEDACNSF